MIVACFIAPVCFSKLSFCSYNDLLSPSISLVFQINVCGPVFCLCCRSWRVPSLCWASWSRRRETWAEPRSLDGKTTEGLRRFLNCTWLHFGLLCIVMYLIQYVYWIVLLHISLFMSPDIPNKTERASLNYDFASLSVISSSVNEHLSSQKTKENQKSL